MSTSAPPAGRAGASKKKRQKLMIAGAAGVLLLLFLYYRSQSSASSSTTGASTNATNAADVQAAVDQAVAQQQQTDAAMYGYGSYGSGGGGGGGYSSPSMDTTGLATSTDIQSLPSEIVGAMQSAGIGMPPAAPATPAAAAATAPAPVTINVGPAAQPVSAGRAPGATAQTRMSTVSSVHMQHGWKALPFGAVRPRAPVGYHTVGLGNGNWAAAPGK